MAKPNRAYVTARQAQIKTRQGLSETRIPAHLRTIPEQSQYEGIRHGKVRNKVGMWGNLSPYYSNSVTIDSRWSQTAKDQNS